MFCTDINKNIVYKKMESFSRQHLILSHKRHSYSFGDELVKTDTSVALRSSGLGYHFSLRVARLLEDILRLDRFRVPLHGS